MASDFLRFDLYAAILLVGVAQGFFLTLLFLSKRPHRQPYHHILLAALVFLFSCVTLEIFLSYTGLMFRMLPLVDFSEPANYAFGPVTYLLVRSLSGKDWNSKQWLHLAPFFFYFIYHFLFLLQPEELKFNAYLSSYFPEAAPIPASTLFNPDPLHLIRWVNEITLVQMSIYIAASYYLIYRQRPAQSSNVYFYSWIKVLLFCYAAMLALFVFVKLAFEKDLGDHFLAVMITGQLFFISYKMLTGSSFFQPVVQVKYEKSALSGEAKQELLRKLKAAEEARFYIQPSASLPGLAKQLHTSPHYLSQALNECLGKSFFEYLAELRIQDAKAILTDPTQQHLKIEEVAEQTGYMSKSAFSAAFKKYTGLTPGQYRKTTAA